MNAQQALAKIQSNNLLMVAVVGAGLYLAYKAFKGVEKVGEAASDVVDTVVSKPIAGFINWIISSKPMVVSATMIFETGNTQPASAFTVIPGVSIKKDAEGREYSLMLFRGQRYRVYGRTSNGYYPVVLDK